jgi:hypothetical protein
MAALVWVDIDAELGDRLLGHIVPATLAPHKLDSAAVVITTYMRSLGDP